MPGGEAAGGCCWVNEGVEVEMPGGEVACWRWLMGGLEFKPRGKAAIKCRVMGRLEFTMPDGEAGGVPGSVTGGRVAKMPGAEAVGEYRVLGRLEVVMPDREAVGDLWEYVMKVPTWLIGLR